jgi:flagellar biogenesis protein FliO
MKNAISMLAAAALCLTAAQAAPGKSLYSASAPRPAEGSESMAAVSAAELPPPPPSPAMEEKFRKLKKEMDRKDPPDKPGQSAKTPENTPKPDGVSVGGLALQILFGLAFVLLLAVVSIRGLKRMQGRLLSKSGKGGDIFEVLETCHLGTHQRIVAMRMNDEVGILGVTQQGISLLTVLKDPIDELRRSRGVESNSAAFSDNLNKLLERFKKPKKVSDLLDEGAA